MVLSSAAGMIFLWEHRWEQLSPCSFIPMVTHFSLYLRRHENFFWTSFMFYVFCLFPTDNERKDAGSQSEHKDKRKRVPWNTWGIKSIIYWYFVSEDKKEKINLNIIF